MPRYLTPARVGLLFLIELYFESDRHNCLDHYAAAGILEFIAKHTTLTVDNDAQLIEEKNDICTLDISSFRPHLQPFDATYVSHHWNLTRHGTAWDAFLATCFEHGSKGQQDLHDLITRLRTTRVRTPGSKIRLTQPVTFARPVTPGSPLGQFIRRCYIEFTRLQFGDLQALWKSFELWRASGWEQLVKFCPVLTQEILHHQQERNSNEETHASFCQRTDFATDAHNTAAAVDTDMLLTHAIRQLQQLGTRVPENIKTKLASWVDELSASSAGTQSMHFFMAFFEHSKAGQYTMALESLHRYFDYSLAARNSGGAGDNVNLRIYYQYALLHLSVLHADFECWEESVDAMNECIATARENQDTACLNFALSWLLYLRHAHPGKGTAAYASISGVVGGGEQDEIAFLKTKAREGKNWLLMSSTLLEEGRQELFCGGNANRAQEHVLQARYLSMQHDLRTMAPAAQLFYGSCMERLGQAHLANRQYEIANTVHAAHCPVNDRVRATCRSALALAYQGCYTKALSLLDDLTSTVRSILKSYTRVQVFSALIHFRRSIHRGTHEASSYYINQVLPLLSAADPELSHEFYALQVEHYVAQNDYPRAMEKVNIHLNTTGSQGTTADLAQRLYWLIQKARIFAEAGRAAKGFSLCLRATFTAERHLLVPIMLEGLAVLGRVLIQVGEFEAAQEMYQSALPVALGGGNARLVARMWVGMGESCVGLAGKMQQREDDGDASSVAGEQIRLMRRAEDGIERGRAVFEKLEDVEGQMVCLRMKSRILQWSGDEGAMRQAEEMFANLVMMKRQQMDG